MANGRLAAVTPRPPTGIVLKHDPGSADDKFYPEGNKIIPKNIADILTPLGLAYWLGDDGNFRKSHNVITFSTDSYSESEVDLLMSVLTNKFELDCRKVKNGNGWRIVIKRSSLEKFRELVSPHVHSSMLYKFLHPP